MKGILLGIGAGIGQGVGLVLSKVGMQHYADAVPAGAPAIIGTMMPFASTLMALTPVFILLPEALVNKKKIKPREILGVLVSIAGVAMFFLL